MAIFCPLYSGSSGNSTYLDAGESALLIDLGVSCRAAVTALQQLGADFSKLKGILITHEHSDHIKGLRVFLKKYPLPLYATEPVLEYLREHVELPAGLPLYEADPEGFCVGQMMVRPFATSHDSLSSFGYAVNLPDGRRISVATDLGYVSDEVHQAIHGSDLVLLESNYDEAMLRCGPYPYPLKRRIASDSGHLSNDSSALEARTLVDSGTTRLVLGHLSKENNHPELARETVRSELTLAGMAEGGDYLLSVAPRTEPGPMMIF